MTTDHTEQIPMSQYWASTPADQQEPAYPGYPGQTPTPPPPAPPAGHERNSRPRRRLAETAGVALLAAVLASGGTYALTQGGDNGSAVAVQTSSTTADPTSNSSPTIVQGNAAAPDWVAVAKAVAPSVVSINVTTQQGGDAGSGVIYDASGHIVTNNHVVTAAAGGGGSITVTLADGRTYAATIVGTDPSTDLAVIKLTDGPSDLTPMTLGNSEALTVGDPVMAIGNPLGLSGTVTTGIVSALNRPVSTGGSGQSPSGNRPAAQPVVTNAIQTSAAINPGNSGGALVNGKGELVGINSAIASLGQSSQGAQSGNIGIGFAIPVKEAKSIADQLIKSGKAEHAFLGVSSSDATVTDGSAKRAGAQIVKVESGTPAAKAGLKNGDVITAVDGQPVDSATALVGQVRELAAGDQAKLTVFRGGAKQTITVTLAVKPDKTN